MCVCVRVVLYEEEKEQKSEETFSPEFSFLFLSLPETRERRTRDRNNTQVIHIYRETSEGKRERDVGPGDDQRSLLFLLRGKAVVEDQSPLARPGRGVRVFLVRDGTLFVGVPMKSAFVSFLCASFFFSVLLLLLLRVRVASRALGKRRSRFSNSRVTHPVESERRRRRREKENERKREFR